jgi:protein required for attachment to host cells
MSTTWILVADSSRARLFAVSAGDPAVAEIGDFTNPDGRASGRELSSERPPRTHDRFGAHRHAIEPRTSEHDKAVERFARELDDVLERGRTDHCYQKLMLIAPPHFLGALNSALGKQVRAHIVAEVAKDLTEADAETIRVHIPAQFHRHAPMRL